MSDKEIPILMPRDVYYTILYYLSILTDWLVMLVCKMENNFACGKLSSLFGKKITPTAPTWKLTI